MMLKQAAYLGAGIFLCGLCGSASAEGIALGIGIPYTPRPAYVVPQPAPMLIAPPPVYVAPLPPPAYVFPAPGFAQSPVSATTTVTGPVYLAPRSMLAPATQPTVTNTGQSVSVPPPASSPGR